MTKLSSKPIFDDSATSDTPVQMILRAAEFTLTNYPPATADEADVVITNILGSCEALNVSKEDRIDLFSKVADMAIARETPFVADLADEQSVHYIDETEDALPLSSDFGGRTPVMH